jgi:hypothetical protein
VLKAIVEGGGYLVDLIGEGSYVLPFFQALLKPDGRLGMCRLADKNGFPEALAKLQSQASQGGIELRMKSKDKVIGGICLKKEILCSAYGSHKSKGTGERNSTSKKVSSSIWRFGSSWP